MGGFLTNFSQKKAIGSLPEEQVLGAITYFCTKEHPVGEKDGSSSSLINPTFLLRPTKPCMTHSG